MQEAYYEARAMKPIQFDSLGYFNELKAADVPDAQAQAQAKALHKVLEDALVGHMADLVTKSDLSREIGLVRKDMEAGFAAAESDRFLIRKEMETGFLLVRRDMETSLAEAKADRDLIRKDIEAMQNKLVIRLSVVMASMFAFVELVHRVF